MHQNVLFASMAAVIALAVIMSAIRIRREKTDRALQIYKELFKDGFLVAFAVPVLDWQARWASPEANDFGRATIAMLVFSLLYWSPLAVIRWVNDELRR